MSKRGWFWLRVTVVTAVLVAALVWLVDLRQMGRTLAAASLPLVLLALAVSTLDTVVMGLKWNLVLRAFGVHVAAWAPVVAYLRGQVFGLFVPSVLGMDAYRAYDLKKRGAPLGAVVPSIVIERFLGMLSSVSVIALLFPFAVEGLDLPYVRLWFWGAWGSLLVVLGFFYVSVAHSERVSELGIWRFLPGKIERLTRSFFAEVGRLRSKKAALAWYFLFSNVEKIFYGSTVFLAARAVGLDQLGYLHIVGAIPLIALLERLPISPQAIGLREGLFVALLAPYGVDATTAFTVAVIIRLVELVRAGLGMLLWLKSDESPAAAAAMVERSSAD